MTTHVAFEQRGSDRIAHYYVDGVKVPSVGRILRDEGFAEYPDRPADELEIIFERGRRIHRACQALDDGLLDWGALDPERERPQVEAYQRFLTDTDCVVIENEVKLLAPSRLYWGKPDKRVMLYGNEAILDLKHGGEYPRDRLQVAGYAQARDCRGYVLILSRRGTFKIIEPTAEDGRTWSAAVETWWWKRKNMASRREERVS